ncbi:MAG: MazG-like family protein [Streptococcus mitis]|nr:MazG-like family protein [Streptococcus mitis]
MNTIDKVKQWFIDRDLENGGRLDKQSLKISEEFGELCAGYLKKNEKLTKDSIGYCAVVIVGLALLIKADVHKIFDEVFSDEYYVIESLAFLNRVISNIQLSNGFTNKDMYIIDLTRSIYWLKSISNALGYNFDECFELAYQEIKDRKGRWIDGTFVREEDLG